MTDNLRFNAIEKLSGQGETFTVTENLTPDLEEEEIEENERQFTW